MRIFNIKSKMLRAVSTLLAVMILLSISGISAFAESTNILFNSSSSADVPPTKGLTDDGADFDTEWDFEDFTWNSTTETTAYPDTISEPVWWVEKGNQGKTSVGDTDRGKSLKFSDGNPGLYLLFGKLIKTGTLHATFYMKQGSEGTGGFLMGLATGYYDNLAVKKGGEKGTFIKIENEEFYWSMDNPYTPEVPEALDKKYWATNTLSFEPNTWHRIDYVVTDNATNADGLDLYLDGVKISSTGAIPLTQMTYGTETVMSPGIKGLRFGEWAVAIPTTYLDDVRVRRYNGSKGLVLEAQDTVAMTGGVVSEEGRTNLVMDISLTDLVDKALLTKENIKVIKMSDGSTLSNYTISNATSTGFKLTFDGTLPYGSYTIKFDDTIVGKVTGDKAVPFNFRTVYRSDGVNNYPVVDLVSFYDYEGNLAEGAEKTSFVNKVELTFNCEVDEATALAAINVAGVDDETVSISTIGGVSKAVINFPSLLDGDSDYTLEVSAGIKNAEQTITSEEADAMLYEFSTLDDAAFRVIKNEVDGGIFKFKYTKNDNRAYKLSAFAVKYDTTVGADGKTYKKVTNVKMVPVSLSAGEKTVPTEVTVAGTIANDAELFIRSYPDMSEVELDNGNTGDIVVY